MSETKKELRWFSIMDYEKEARYLSRMHQKGWKFKRVTMPGIYTFEKCEPEKVIYQLDYNQEGMKNQMEYVKMFEDCGWEYLLEFAGYSYFRKPEAQMSREEEIFCDDEIEAGYDEPDLPGKSNSVNCDFLLSDCEWVQCYGRTRRICTCKCV